MGPCKSGCEQGAVLGIVEAAHRLSMVVVLHGGPAAFPCGRALKGVLQQNGGGKRATVANPPARRRPPRRKGRAATRHVAARGRGDRKDREARVFAGGGRRPSPRAERAAAP